MLYEPALWSPTVSVAKSTTRGGAPGAGVTTSARASASKTHASAETRAIATTRAVSADAKACCSASGSAAHAALGDSPSAMLQEVRRATSAPDETVAPETRAGLKIGPHLRLLR